MLLQHLVVNLRLIIKAVDKRHRIELNQIFITRLVFCKQNKVLGCIRGLVVHVLCHIKLTADYIFYPCGEGFFGKLQSAVHIAVVGNTYGVYAVLFAIADKIVYFTRAVKQRVFGMEMQVYKIRHIFILSPD